jgi:hypothetical protein
LEPVVQVIWPIVNVRPAVMAMESGKMTILHARKAVHTPYLVRHCRQNLVDSLSRGMPKIVYYQ